MRKIRDGEKVRDYIIRVLEEAGVKNVLARLNGGMTVQEGIRILERHEAIEKGQEPQWREEMLSPRARRVLDADELP